MGTQTVLVVCIIAYREKSINLPVKLRTSFTSVAGMEASHGMPATAFGS